MKHEHDEEEMIFDDYEMRPICVGETVPNLEFEIFQNDKTKKVKLHEYKGKWLILFFYPADFTFVCPTELEELADNYEAFKKEGAEIVSVSTDTVFVHKAWHDTSEAIKKIKFPMAADPSGKISRTFGTYVENTGAGLTDDEGLSLRGTFIINPEGQLKSIEINDNSIGRSARELLRKLQAAKYVATHKGQVCPASWEPGQETLKPGMDLVGKI